jgi:hypothetical protein
MHTHKEYIMEKAKALFDATLAVAAGLTVAWCIFYIYAN